jgi:hypothetical protein
MEISSSLEKPTVTKTKQPGPGPKSKTKQVLETTVVNQTDRERRSSERIANTNMSVGQKPGPKSRKSIAEIPSSTQSEHSMAKRIKVESISPTEKITEFPTKKPKPGPKSKTKHVEQAVNNKIQMKKEIDDAETEATPTPTVSTHGGSSDSGIVDDDNNNNYENLFVRKNKS